MQTGNICSLKAHATPACKLCQSLEAPGRPPTYQRRPVKMPSLPQFALMSFSLMMSPHFFASACMKSRRADGVDTAGSAPTSTMRRRIAGSAIALLNWARFQCGLSIIACARRSI